jgi:O-antigen/teichoic acid export membrane protein
VLTAHDRTADTARIIVIAALVNIVGDLIAIGGFGAGSWAPAVATTSAGLIVAIGYLRVAGKSTGGRVRLTLAPYVAPAVAVLALVLAPDHWRAGASVAIAVIATGLTLALRSRAYGIDRELIGSLSRIWRR